MSADLRRPDRSVGVRRGTAQPRGRQSHSKRRTMIKRMLVMLVLFGVVLGGLFGFKGFVNGKIKEAMAGMANTPQTVSAAKAGSSDWQPTIDAVGSLRAVRGADLSLEVPGVVEEILFQSGDEVQAGPDPAAAARRGRDRQAAVARGDGAARPDHLRPRRQAAQGPGDQPGGRRQRRGQPAQRQGAGRPAEGDRRQEDPARALRRQARPAPGRSRPVPLGRHGDRHPAVARSDLRRLPAAAAGGGAAHRRSQGRGQGRRLPRPRVHGQDHRHQSQDRDGEPQHPGARHAAQRRPEAAARHVRHGAARDRRRRSAWSRCRRRR